MRARRGVAVEDRALSLFEQHPKRATDGLDVDRAHANRRRFQTGTAVRTDPTSQRRISRSIAGKVNPQSEIVEKNVTPTMAT